MIEHEIQKDIEEIWEKICGACNKIINDTKLFGFMEIGLVPNPNIHDMVRYLVVIDKVLDSILMLVECNEADHVDSRVIFNSKQQIFNMKQMANAVVKNDIDLYNEYLHKLKNQSLI